MGKTVEELKNGAIDESGRAARRRPCLRGHHLSGGYVSAIEAAAANAQHLGAQKGDRLALTSTASLGSSQNASADEDGRAQLDVTIAAVTFSGDTISSCLLDGVAACCEL